MQKRFTALVALILTLALLAGATGSAALQGPASISQPETTSLNTTDSILQSVSRLRGLEIKRPVKSGLKTKDEIEQSVIRDMDEETSPEEFAATTKTLTKLGLLPKGFQLRDFIVKLLREQVAGFYEPKSQEFFLAAWLPISEQKTVMAHELMHALQDQHFNLRRFERWPKGDSDAETAAHALVEGEATIVMYQFAAEKDHLVFDVTRMESLTQRMLEQSGEMDQAMYPVLSSAPTVLREGLQFPYIYGIGFVQEILKHRSWKGVNQSYDRLPNSTEQIIHPERFLFRDEPVRIKIADLQQVLGPKFRKVDMDVNGEFGYQILLGEFIDKREARLAAEGWGGDCYELYEDASTGALVLAQYTTWDRAKDAKEFFDLYSKRIMKRYSVDAPGDLAARPRVYETSEGLVSIELRDKDVVIIEGARTRDELTRLSNRLWESKKK
ncbi:MAG TPA: hypothetical protein VKA70_22495 [Blastocatellia bacterium]|nr:hypothetical protein [Blastocatellia bacterium]